MTARDIFGVIVRTAGLVGVAHGLPGLQGMINPPEGYSAMNYIAGYEAEIIGGSVLLFAAGPIVWLSYLGTNPEYPNLQP